MKKGSGKRTPTTKLSAIAIDANVYLTANEIILTAVVNVDGIDRPMRTEIAITKDQYESIKQLT